MPLMALTQPPNGGGASQSQELFLFRRTITFWWSFLMKFHKITSRPVKKRGARSSHRETETTKNTCLTFGTGNRKTFRNSHAESSNADHGWKSLSFQKKQRKFSSASVKNNFHSSGVGWFHSIIMNRKSDLVPRFTAMFAGEKYLFARKWSVFAATKALAKRSEPSPLDDLLGMHLSIYLTQPT